jgi:hypothetical protein
MKSKISGKCSLGPVVARFSRLGVCLLLLVGPGACGFDLDFEAVTVVFADGTATRETRFLASSKEGIEQRLYVLPPGGKWENGVRKRMADGKELESERIYEVKKRYPAGSPIASDFVRKARYSVATAHNEPRLNVGDYLFVKIFNYEERFRDIVTPESVDTAARQIFGAVVHHGARLLSPDGLLDVETERVLKATFNSLLERFLNVVHSEGIEPAMMLLLKEGGELHGAINPEQVVPRVIEVLPPPKGHTLESWRLAVAAAYRKAVEQADKDVPAWEEALFGAHGFALFDTYRFALTVTLPGEILENNATRREGNRLVWVFQSGAFVFENHVLRARSRLVYPERIGIAGVALAAIVLGLWRFRRRRQDRAR